MQIGVAGSLMRQLERAEFVPAPFGLLRVTRLVGWRVWIQFALDLTFVMTMILCKSQPRAPLWLYLISPLFISTIAITTSYRRRLERIDWRRTGGCLEV